MFSSTSSFLRLACMAAVAAGFLLPAAQAKTLSPTGNCGPSNGHLVYFDYSKCSGSTGKWEPRAVSYAGEGVKAYGRIGSHAYNTICIDDEEFEGYIYVEVGSDGSQVGITQQTVHVNFKKGQSGRTGTAYVQSRSDDHLGAKGSKRVLPVIAEISNFRFSDTSHTSKGLNSKSPPKKILYAHTPHVAMYVDYCGASSV